MSAQTPIYGIEYPTESDLVRDIADHLKTEAQTVESALHEVDQRATPAGSAPVIAQNYDQLSTLPGVIGQTGYVTNDVSYRNGAYVYDGTSWTRGNVALGDDVFEFANNTNWDSQYRAWLSAGTLTVCIRMTRKNDYPGSNTSTLRTEKIGYIKQPLLRPPYYYHLPAFASDTTLNNCSSFGIQISVAGDIMIESLIPNAGLKKNSIIEATMTWPTQFNN